MLKKLKRVKPRYPKSSSQMAGEITVGLLLCISSVLFFFAFTQETLQNQFSHFDLWFSQLLLAIRTPLVTNLMLFITSFGAQVTFMLMGVICGFLFFNTYKKEAILFFFTLIVGTLIATLLKYEIQRPRPEFAPLVFEQTSSFPSAHSVNAFLFFALLSFFSYHFFRNTKLTMQITAISVVCIVLVGISRVYLGVHYATDVIAGYILGFWWLVTVLVIDRLLIFSKVLTKST